MTRMIIIMIINDLWLWYINNYLFNSQFNKSGSCLISTLKKTESDKHYRNNTSLMVARPSQKPLKPSTDFR